MNEREVLDAMRKEPDNPDLRRSYCKWLKEREDPRSVVAGLMREREALSERMCEINSDLTQHQNSVDLDWLDIVFPLLVRSPMVGTCYLSPTPDSPPFAAVGQRVSFDSIVCVVEALLIHDEIQANADGIVAEVFVTSEQPVQYNQPLVRLQRVADPWSRWDPSRDSSSFR